MNLGGVLGSVLRNFHALMRSQLWLSHMTSFKYCRNATLLYMYLLYSFRSYIFNLADQSDSRFALPPVAITCKHNHRDQSDSSFILVSCPAPFHARGEKGSGQTCIGSVSPVQHTVHANQMHGSCHMIAWA